MVQIRFLLLLALVSCQEDETKELIKEIDKELESIKETDDIDELEKEIEEIEREEEEIENEEKEIEERQHEKEVDKLEKEEE